MTVYVHTTLPFLLMHTNLSLPPPSFPTHFPPFPRSLSPPLPSPPLSSPLLPSPPLPSLLPSPSLPPCPPPPQELGVRQDYYYYGCYNKTGYIWLIISYAYKLLLQLAAIYFAFMTRKVKVKALNDSKQIAAIIYVTSLLLIISVFGFWIGLLYLNTSAAVFAAAQLVTASVFLGVLFIPKVS